MKTLRGKELVWLRKNSKGVAKFYKFWPWIDQQITQHTQLSILLTRRLWLELVHFLSLAMPSLSTCQGSTLPRFSLFLPCLQVPPVMSHSPPSSQPQHSVQPCDKPSLTASLRYPTTHSWPHSNFLPSNLADSQQVTRPVTWGYLEIISKLKKIKGKRYFVSLRKHMQESFIVFLHPAFSYTKTGLRTGFSGLYKRQPGCTASSKDPGLAPLLQWRGAPKGTHLLPTLGPGIGVHQQPIMLDWGHLSSQLVTSLELKSVIQA